MIQNNKRREAALKKELKAVYKLENKMSEAALKSKSST